MSDVAMMSSLQDKVKERIKGSFLDLVPQEMWESMVKKGIEDFTQKELPALVRETAQAHIRSLLTEELKKPEWADRWTGTNGNGMSVLTSAGISMALKEAAPELVSAMFASFGQQIVQALRNGVIRPY